MAQLAEHCRQYPVDWNETRSFIPEIGQVISDDNHQTYTLDLALQLRVLEDIICIDGVTLHVASMFDHGTDTHSIGV